MRKRKEIDFLKCDACGAETMICNHSQPFKCGWVEQNRGGPPNRHFCGDCIEALVGFRYRQNPPVLEKPND